MRLEKQPGFANGVKCDLCGDDYEDDFTYYSLDIREVSMVAGRHIIGVDQLPVIFSIDSCHKCLQNLMQVVKINYIPTNVGVNCDLCAAQLRGDFKYYYVDVTSVEVMMSRGRIKCASCDRPMVQQSQVCPCGSGHPIKVAVVNVKDKYFQIAACIDDYTRLSNTASAIRQNVAT